MQRSTPAFWFLLASAWLGLWKTKAWTNNGEYSKHFICFICNSGHWTCTRQTETFLNGNQHLVPISTAIHHHFLSQWTALRCNFTNYLWFITSSSCGREVIEEVSWMLLIITDSERRNGNWVPTWSIVCQIISLFDWLTEHQPALIAKQIENKLQTSS